MVCAPRRLIRVTSAFVGGGHFREMIVDTQTFSFEDETLFLTLEAIEILSGYPVTSRYK